jgi:multicomponent Na+:H+ antiporter subunit F
MIELATDISMAMLGVGVVLTLIRILRGPTLADRILGLDTLSVLSIGLIAAYAAHSRLTLYTDIAISLALILPLSTLSLTRYLATRRGAE